MDRTAEYNDYVKDVCGFLHTLTADADWILNNPALIASLWRKTIAGWNRNMYPAQIAADWYNDYSGKKPAARQESDIPANILASREARRQVWAAAKLPLN